MTPSQSTALLSAAARDVLAERERQISAEGWTPEHDDTHTNGELAFAAACYAHQASARSWIFELPDGAERYRQDDPPNDWPDSWDTSWWRPKNQRRDLVRAAALLLAEIERLDRAVPPAAATLRGMEKEGQSGFKLAPLEPTEAMLEAGKDERMECLKLPQSPPLSVGDALARIYAAMLNAAPAQATPHTDHPAPDPNEGLAACPTSRGNLLEVKPNDRKPEEINRGAGEEDYFVVHPGRGVEVHASCAEPRAHGSNPAQHEVEDVAAPFAVPPAASVQGMEAQSDTNARTEQEKPE